MMMNEKQLFCLECDVLLMRLYDLPDLAAVSSAPASADEHAVGAETYTCPECGKVVVRQATGESLPTHI
jgi:hypothetical protein